MTDAPPAPSWTLTADVCTGDTIRFTERIFSGSFRNAKFVGERTVTATILKESYGDLKGQHTFTLQVLHSTGTDPLEPGTVTLRKGRNIYRLECYRMLWSDENKRQAVIDEKHTRGKAVRAKKAQLKAEDFY